MPATLAQRLQAEIRRSPKKAALLALLACVALWYWAPLLGRIGSSKSGSTRQVQPTELTATVAPSATQPLSPTPPTQQPSAPTGPTWEGVLALIENDSRMRPASELPLARDPFRRMPTAEAATEDELAAEQAQGAPANSSTEPAPPELSQAAVELPLTAIIFGPTRRSALIGGRAYRPGDVCPAHGMEFRIVGIGRDHITVERLADGYRFEQSLPRHQHTPHLEIRRGP